MDMLKLSVVEARFRDPIHEQGIDGKVLNTERQNSVTIVADMARRVLVVRFTLPNKRTWYIPFENVERFRCSATTVRELYDAETIVEGDEKIPRKPVQSGRVPQRK